MADIKENEMTSVSSVDYVRGLKGKDSVLIAPGNLPHPNTGSGVVSSKLFNGRWYRIAIGASGNKISSAIINIGKMYNTDSASSKLLYVSADGYSDSQSVVVLSKGGYSLNISKARILYQKSESVKVMLDVYVGSVNSNDYYICYSSNINFTFQTPEEISEAIPEGYSVKEFTL